jgi:hypothetical protein
MAEQLLDYTNIGAVLEKMCRESMAKRVQGHVLAQAELCHGSPQRSADDIDMHRPAEAPREQE